ncbi:MAG TPA: FGGY-family carbohydrate kinase [Vicinamibacterales bacterium]|nr:FGGY-family carbohydrate kinase [Vicinamibacterales bacterium]
MSVYLGLDASTQSLTATLIDASARGVIAEVSLNYAAELPQYGTDHGVIRGDDPRVVTAPPLMWIEALDLMLARLVAEYREPMSRLAAISGSAQQHGSLYLNERWPAALTATRPDRQLAHQLTDTFARELAPVWMDSSTTRECEEIEAGVGGAQALARNTGSRAFERFTGPQIRAFAKHDPAGYARTTRVHLVSSFHASLLSGTDAPIDAGDGSGMNLMSLTTREWWPAAVNATAPELAWRLPPVRPSWTIAGTLARYWRDRYGLPAARVAVWSGDNPCSLIGTGLVREGQLGISLGTSDTVCGMMREPRIHDAGIGYVSASPTGEYMGTTVFKNGSLARERVRDAYGMNWAAFSVALRSTPPGNGGAIMLPWFDPEITPHVLEPGVRRVSLREDDAPGNVRAIIEAQMMAMANHTLWMMEAGPAVIYAMGGASGNRDVLQVMADVFGAEVIRSRAGNAAALGAALRAWHADARASGSPIGWEDVVAGFTDPDPAWRVTPRADATAVYIDLRRRYADAEKNALKSV